jgi:hypothetical protein
MSYVGGLMRIKKEKLEFSLLFIVEACVILGVPPKSSLPYEL